MGKIEPYFKSRYPGSEKDRTRKQLLARFEHNHKKKYESLLQGAYLSTLSFYRNRLSETERNRLAHEITANTFIFPQKEYEIILKQIGSPSKTRGVWLPDEKAIVLPESRMGKPKKAWPTLKHEAVHLLRDRFGLGQGHRTEFHDFTPESDEAAPFAVQERYGKIKNSKKFFSAAAKAKKKALNVVAEEEYPSPAYRKHKAFGHTLAILAARLEKTHGKKAARLFLEKVVNQNWHWLPDREERGLLGHPAAEWRKEAIRETANQKKKRQRRR